jgi:alpha-1,2-mannosyltransferase
VTAQNTTSRPGVRRWLTTPWLVVPVVLPVLALLVGALLQRSHAYFLDLDVYRIGVQTWLAGGDIYGPLPPTAIGRELPFIYPPFAAIVLTPLVLLSWNAAWVTLFALSLASIGVTLYVVARSVWPAGEVPAAVAIATAALPLALVLEPVWGTFEFGQVNLILMALVAADCLTHRPRWPRGLLVGLAAAIKLTPAAFVLFFLLRRDTRAAVVAVVTAVAATVLGFLVDPASSLRYWSNGPAAGVSGSEFYTNQTLMAVLTRVGLGEGVAAAVWLVLAAAVLALVVPVVRRAEPALALVALAGCALLLSPTSWSHHYVWIAPAVLVTAVHAVRTRSPGWAAASVGLGVAFALAPFRFLPGDGGRELGWTGPQQLVGATYVIVVAGLLALLWWRQRRVPA